jgi:hypothetical protein
MKKYKCGGCGKIHEDNDYDPARDTLITQKMEDTDKSSGEIYPVNSKIQGETFESISKFIRPRMGQLIKQVSYTFKVEYYPEESPRESLGKHGGKE